MAQSDARDYSGHEYVSDGTCFFCDVASDVRARFREGATAAKMSVTISLATTADRNVLVVARF